MASFRQAADWGADILFVHHGLFWGKQMPVTDWHFERIAFLVRNSLALYAVHLPLDADPELGNNIAVARTLGLENTEPFGEYKRKVIGIRGDFPSPVRREKVVEKLFGTGEDLVRLLPFGPEEVTSVGIVSGGASYEAYEAIEKGLDLYITGDRSHTIYHICQEAGINVLFGGHYQTETGGVKAVKDRIEKELNIKTCFIDIPTGL
jgi:dinuclear metal center YbgI/SA1388 family protein